MRTCRRLGRFRTGRVETQTGETRGRLEQSSLFGLARLGSVTVRSGRLANNAKVIGTVDVRFASALVQLDEDWKRELIEIARGKAVHNQVVETQRILIWNNHRFRSQAEVKIAAALEGACQSIE